MSGPAAAGEPHAAPNLDAAMARASVVIALFAVMAALLRVAQDAAIAWRFGTSAVVDAYHVSLALVSWPGAFVLAMLTLLVPPAEAALRQQGTAAVDLWRREMFGWTIVCACLALPLAWWSLTWLFKSNTLGFSVAAATESLASLPLIVASVPLGLLVATASACLLSTRGQVLSLLEALPPLTLLLLLLLAPSSGSVLFWGSPTALAVQLVVTLGLLHRIQALSMPSWHLRSPEWPRFAKASLVLVGGQMLFALTPLVDPFFAARLGEGQVATMSYANRLILGILSVLGLGLQRAGMPLLSHLATTRPKMLWKTVLRWSLAAALTGIGIGAVVAWLADPMVALLFERGSFTAADRERVAFLLQVGMIQLPLFLFGLVMVTALASGRAVGLLAAVTAVGLSVKLLFSALWAPTMGLIGLSLATSMMYLCTAVVAALALRRHLGRRHHE